MGQITFQYCSFNSLAGGLIEWFTQGSVGHVDIVLPSWHPQAGDLLGAQHQDGLGGQPSGVQIRPASYVLESGGYGIKRVTLNTSDACERASYEWALSLIGTEYDTWNIIAMSEGRVAPTPGKLICSGLASGLLCQPNPSFIGHNLVRPWRCITPEQHMLICNGFAPIIDVE